MLDKTYKDWIITKERITKNTIDNHKNAMQLHGNTLSTIEDWILFLQREQEDSLVNWFSFFEQKNLDMKTRKWILESIKRMGKFSRKHYYFHRRNVHTIHPFAEINESCVQRTLEENQNVSFKKMYEQELKSLLSEKNNNGIWRTYQGYESVNNLTKDIQGYFTDWCITNPTAAYLHLLEASIDIFFTETKDGTNYPRVALSRNKKEIIHIVGVEERQGLEQDLKEEILDYLDLNNLPLSQAAEEKIKNLRR